MKFLNFLSIVTAICGMSFAAPTSDTSDISNVIVIKDQLNFSNKYKFRKATGSSEIQLHRSGKVLWTGRFHDSGAVSYDYSVACALRDDAGHAYTLSHKGVIKGALAKGSRTSKWSQTKTSSNVKKFWAEINKSGKVTCKAKVNWDIKNALKEIVADVKKFGPIAAEVIALF
jgi:hypothetical protein